MSNVGFMHLPAELRFMVYGNLTSPSLPLTNHLATMKGLLLSCKLVFHELQTEILKNTNEYLVNIKAEWDLAVPNSQLQTSSPTTLAEVRTGIEIRIPNSFFRDRCSRRPLRAATRHVILIGIPRALVLILPLHVTHICVATYEDQKGPEATPFINNFVPLLRFFSSFRKLLGESLSPIKLDDGTMFDTTNNPLCADSLTFSSGLRFWGTQHDLMHNMLTRNHPVMASIVEHYLLHPFGGGPHRPGRVAGDWADENYGKWRIQYNTITVNGIRVLTGKTFHKLVKAPGPHGPIEYVKELKERH